MNKSQIIFDEKIFKKARAMGKKKLFAILWLTQNKELTVTELSKSLVLAYTKCTTYVSSLHKLGLVSKRKEGRQVFVKSKVHFHENEIKLIQ